MSNNHWPLFIRFIRQELAVGGPDAQLSMLAHIPKDDNKIGHAWLIGCYCAHHTVQGAFAVYRAFPQPAYVVAYPDKLKRFLKIHWKALPLRREMRSHQMLEKRTECLVSFARYTLSKQWKRGSYDDVWDSSIRNVKYFGRYMALKYLEILRMTLRPELKLRDLRAKHAWSPRISLALLYPKHRNKFLDRNDNSEHTIFLVEKYAKNLYQTLRLIHHIDLNFFQLQVLLCNYKQAITGRFYPGMGLDEEMMYSDIAETHFNMRPLYKIRKHIFRKRDLGEISGWHGIRQDQLNYWKTLGENVNE